MKVQFIGLFDRRIGHSTSAGAAKDCLSHTAVDLDDVDTDRYIVEQAEALRTGPKTGESQLDWQRCIQKTRAFIENLDTDTCGAVLGSNHQASGNSQDRFQ